MSDDDATAARRKAMAEAIRDREEELMQRPAWDAAGRFMELATAADLAAQRNNDEGR